MSWSVQVTGKPKAALEALEGQFKSMSICAEPEEGIKQNIRAAISLALSAMGPHDPVKVTASGSQGDYDWGKPPHERSGHKHNQFSVTVEPLYGFVE